MRRNQDPQSLAPCSTLAGAASSDGGVSIRRVVTGVKGGINGAETWTGAAVVEVVAGCSSVRRLAPVGTVELGPVLAEGIACTGARRGDLVGSSR